MSKGVSTEGLDIAEWLNSGRPVHESLSVIVSDAPLPGVFGLGHMHCWWRWCGPWGLTPGCFPLRRLCHVRRKTVNGGKKTPQRHKYSQN